MKMILRNVANYTLSANIETTQKKHDICSINNLYTK